MFEVRRGGGGGGACPILALCKAAVLGKVMAKINLGRKLSFKVNSPKINEVAHDVES